MTHEIVTVIANIKVKPGIVGADLVQGTADVTVVGVDDPEITRAGRRSVVAAHELVVQALE